MLKLTLEGQWFILKKPKAETRGNENQKERGESLLEILYDG